MVTPDQVSQYREEGFALVSGLFDERELALLEAEFDGVIERRLARGAKLEALWPGDWRKQHAQGRQIIHTHDVQAYSAAWARVLTHDRFTEAFARLMGSENIQLHHTKLFQKPPEHGGAFPMHQDAPYFPHENHTMMAGIIHLTDATEEMGCLRVYPGTHKLGLLPEDNTAAHYLDQQRWPVEKAMVVEAKRGDVIFFNYLTVHGSGVNRSTKTRKTVLVQVRDPADRPLDDQHHSHAQGLMMRGVNPLAYSSTVAGTLGSGAADGVLKV